MMTAALLEHPIVQKLRRVPLAKVNSWATLIIGVYCIYLFSQITWQVITMLSLPDGAQPVRPEVVSKQMATKSSQSLNMRPVANSHLFGKKQVKPAAKPAAEPVIKDVVKKSSLKAKLRAVYASSDTKLANATVELNRGEQNVYFVGDKFSGAELLEVRSDSIIIKRNGGVEAISMEDFAPARAGASSNRAAYTPRSTNRARSKRVLDKRNDRKASAELRKLKEQLQTNPASVSDLITGSPYMQDGQFKGFKIRPGKNRRLFSRLGLRSNDVVTNINGTNLDSPQTAMSMMGQIGSVEELSLTVLRGQQEVSLQFSLGQ